MKFDPSAFRVAVCQLNYHPATVFTLGNRKQILPLREPVYPASNPLEALILDRLEIDAPGLKEARKSLQESLTHRYLEDFTTRVQTILQACKAWNVDLVVFPEFSIPGECLLELKAAADGMMVVFGSHTASIPLLKSPLYSSLCWTPPGEGVSVVPVLKPDGGWICAARYRQRKELLWGESDGPVPLGGDHSMLVLPGDPWHLERVSPTVEDRLREQMDVSTLLVGPFLGSYPEVLGSWFYSNDRTTFKPTPTTGRYLVTCPDAHNTSARVQLRAPESEPLWHPGTESQVDRVLMGDLNFQRATTPHKVLEAKVVPGVHLPGWAKLVQQVDAAGDDLAVLRRVIEENTALLRGWQSILSLAQGDHLQEWRRKLDDLFDEDRVLDPLDLRNMAGGFIPLPEGCPTAKQLELGLAWATDDVLERWNELGEARRESRELLRRHLSMLGGKAKLEQEASVVQEVTRKVLDRAKLVGVTKPVRLVRDNPPPPHFKKIQIKNIGPFQDLVIDLRDSSPGEGQWIVVLGDNSSGKTTLLRSLALVTADPDIAVTSFTSKEGRYIHWGKAEGSVDITLDDAAGSIDVALDDVAGSIDVALDDAEGSIDVALDDVAGSIDVALDDAPLPEFRTFSVRLEASVQKVLQPQEPTGEEGRERETILPERSDIDRPFPIFAYGSQRGTAQGGPDRSVRLDRYSAVITLFNNQAGLVHAQTWLVQQNFAALKNPKGPEERTFESVLSLLRRVLPRVKKIEVTPEDVWIEGLEPHAITLSQLSDGYLTTLGWVIDLIARWMSWARTRNLPIDDGFNLNMTGLVLLDEIDLHLHPLWQTAVIQSIREAFPKLSFVITTHSPLVLFGARAGEIYVLRRDPESRELTLRAVEIEGGARVDQLYTSVFELPSVVDPKTQELLKEHHKLLRQGRPAAALEAAQWDDQREKLEATLRGRLGSFADTSIERMVQSVVAEEAFNKYPNQDYLKLSEEARASLRKKAQDKLRELRVKQG